MSVKVCHSAPATSIISCKVNLPFPVLHSAIEEVFSCLNATPPSKEWREYFPFLTDLYLPFESIFLWVPPPRRNKFSCFETGLYFMWVAINGSNVCTEFTQRLWSTEYINSRGYRGKCKADHYKQLVFRV